jgi:serine/threonine-protein kinase
VEDRQFGRRYRITEKIGSGGMADVYKAVDEVLGRTVAVKVMHPRYAADPTFASRFRHEAQAAANLSSPNIVNMYDWGQDGDTYYIVMEYVRGTDLKSIIHDRGAIDSRHVADIGAQVAAALTVAHGYDIIHRDIKPHNIMVQPDGIVKVMDFGIARAGNSTMTQTGSVLGTAHYVSPEQAQGKPLTAASDLYSLGVVLYECSTGELPFDGDTPVAVALKQVNETPRTPRSINADVDPGLEAIILKAMSKNPALRYDTAADMRRDLQAVERGGSPIEAGVSAGGGPASVPASETAVMPAVSGEQYGRYEQARPREVARRRPVWPWAVLAAALIIVGLGIAWQNGLLGFKTLPVPDVTGKTLTQAEKLLTAEEFKVGPTTREYSDKIPKDHVVTQSPAANTPVEKGATVNLVLSKGPELLPVPDVVGKLEAVAKQIIIDAKFSPSSAGSEYNKDYTPGTVMMQSPTATDGPQPKGSLISYTISLGPEVTAVPDVSNKSEAEAKSILVKAGFKSVSRLAYSDTVPSGKVISQLPSAASKADKGSTVTITISQGPQNIDVPDVIGQTAAAAEATLTNAGFVVTKTYESHSNNGLVIGMNPQPPVKLQRGANVTLVIDATGP